MTEFNIVREPKVRILAQSQINLDVLQDIADEKDLDDNSPLTRMIQDKISNDVSDIDLVAEFAGRVCYDSFVKGRSHKDYIDNILSSGHGNVFEHSTITFFIEGVSRALTHELVRHSVGASPSQESQRFVVDRLINAGVINIIVPPILDDASDELVLSLADSQIENFKKFHAHIKQASPDADKKAVNEASRAVLANWMETKLVFTTNIRALRNILQQRGRLAGKPDKEIRRLSVAMLKAVQDRYNLTCLSDFTTDGESVDLTYEKV